MPVPHFGAASKIIIADDDELLGAVLASSLESQGYRTVRLPYGRVSQDSPMDADLVILDAHVPGQDFRATRRFLLAQPLAVLVMSGELSPPQDVEPDEYVSKPVELAVLLAIVARLLAAAKGS